MTNTKEVYFIKYCNKCVNENLPETSNPCNDCLAQPFMLDSHKPLYFKSINDNGENK